MNYRGKAQQIGTVQAPFTLVNRVPVTANSYTRLAQTARHMIGLPTPSSDLSVGGRLITAKLDASNRRLLKCVLQSTSAAAAAGTCTVDVWGIRAPIEAMEGKVTDGDNEPDEYDLDLRLTLAFVAGTSIVNPDSKKLRLARSLGMKSAAWCDLCTITDYTRAGGAIKYGQAGGGIVIDFDSEGFERYLLEVTPASGYGAHFLLSSL